MVETGPATITLRISGNSVFADWKSNTGAARATIWTPHHDHGLISVRRTPRRKRQVRAFTHETLRLNAALMDPAFLDAIAGQLETEDLQGRERGLRAPRLPAKAGSRLADTQNRDVHSLDRAQWNIPRNPGPHV